VDEARLYDVPKQPVPIYVMAGGPKSVRLAGKIGDGLISDSQRAIKSEMRRAFEEGAKAAGKNPAAMPILAEHLVVVGDKKGAERGAERWRFMPKAWERYVSDPDPRSIQRRAERDIPLEQVYGSWTVSEDPEAHIQAQQKLIDQSVTQVYLHSPQADQAKVIRFYGEKVLPNLSQMPLAGSRR
jgi:alkanesulfonate monooxygenase SsuD/methylene tetrahydromethanopterin reductase-like flavin-dependent oxidoreductase (luciferase family)